MSGFDLAELSVLILDLQYSGLVSEKTQEEDLEDPIEWLMIGREDQDTWKYGGDGTSWE